jgi:hypothetical protein
MVNSLHGCEQLPLGNVNEDAFQEFGTVEYLFGCG